MTNVNYIEECQINKSYSLASMINSDYVQCIIDGKNVNPPVGYNFGRFLEVSYSSNFTEQEFHEEYYMVTYTFVFENGTIIDEHWENRMEERHCTMMSLMTST